MAKQSRLKPLLPTLKEKKRYLAFEILSDEKLEPFLAVSKAISTAAISFVGSKGVAQMGLQVFKEKYNEKSQKGIIKVTHRSVDAIKASLTLVRKVGGLPVIVRSLGVSGILKKAEEKYMK